MNRHLPWRIFGWGLAVYLLLLCIALILPSLPITIFLWEAAFREVANAAVNLRMSKGVRFSPGFPPIVPLIPEILFINGT